MNSDGSSVQQMTDGGYASSPSWSPNDSSSPFAWDRKYGPRSARRTDIYVMEVATRKWTSSPTTEAAATSPPGRADNRHIVYANSSDGRANHMRVWTMLTDGTQRRPLTGPGADMPNWSWK